MVYTWHLHRCVDGMIAVIVVVVVYTWRAAAVVVVVYTWHLHRCVDGMIAVIGAVDIVARPEASRKLALTRRVRLM